MGKVHVVNKVLNEDELLALDYETYCKLFDRSTWKLSDGVVVNTHTQQKEPLSSIYTDIKNIKNMKQEIIAKRKQKYGPLLVTSTFFEVNIRSMKKKKMVESTYFPVLDSRGKDPTYNDLTIYKKHLRSSKPVLMGVPLQALPFESQEKCKEFLLAQGCRDIRFYVTKQSVQVVTDRQEVLEALL
ncbi:hypothetical protein LIV60_002671 [Listeria monocytogenes]|nr:hypothetical protein [Listeria monocytogenes]